MALQPLEVALVGFARPLVVLRQAAKLLVARRLANALALLRAQNFGRVLRALGRGGSPSELAHAPLDLSQGARDVLRGLLREACGSVVRLRKLFRCEVHARWGGAVHTGRACALAGLLSVRRAFA